MNNEQRVVETHHIITLVAIFFAFVLVFLSAWGMPARCVPGKQEHCGCPRTADGHWQEGIQVCADTGKRYSACECRELP